jgi:hypothetical protein
MSAGIIYLRVPVVDHREKTLPEWRAFVADVQRALHERREQQARERERQRSAEQTVKRAVRRLRGTHPIVSERLLDFTERRALYELSESQCAQLGIGQCESCGERQFFDAGEMAEMYDPRNPETGSKTLHVDCTPEGWDTA